MTPKQRNPGQTGGAGHKASMGKSAARGGWPRTGNAGGGKTPKPPKKGGSGKGCMVLLLLGLTIPAAVATAFWEWLL